jgi:hypothetical protein
VEKSKASKVKVVSQFNVEEILLRTKFYRIYLKIKGLLKVLESFVSNKLVSHIQTTFDYGTVSRPRQNIVREESVLALLLWLVASLFPDRDEIKTYVDDVSQIEQQLGDEHDFIFQIEATC